jgi:hypothetical protein
MNAENHRENSQLSSWIEDNSNVIGSIVIDEIQTVLTSKTFRPVMLSVGALMATKVSITFLTATLPVRLEKTLKTMLVMPADHTVIRANTARPEHQYLTFMTTKEELLEVTIPFISLISLLSLHGERRGIIFVRSKQMGEDLHTMFPQIEFFHAGIVDDLKRSEMIENWKLGLTGGWIIGTTSLIQGIDYHDVHMVVFVASPYNLIDFNQGAGRAGRNGKPSKVIVLYTGKPPGPSPLDPDDLSCRREMIKWFTGRCCKRTLISECMDGVRNRTCRDIPNAVLCGYCGPDQELEDLWRRASRLSSENQPATLDLRLTKAASALRSTAPTPLAMVPIRPRIANPEVLKHSLKELSLQQARLETASECIDRLKAFSPNCGICHAESGGKKKTGKTHGSIKKCSVGSHFSTFYDWNKPVVRGQRLWSYDVGVGHWCWACALPQKTLKERERGHDRSECPWSDTMQGVAWSIWHNKEVFEEMKLELLCRVPCGLGQTKKVEWLMWLADKNLRRTAYNIHEVWLWYYGKYVL